MILTIRTDKPEAEISLYSNSEQVQYHKWRAHRELSNTLLVEIENLLKKEKLTTTDISGVIVFKGPGSFTGLRIGITVANTIAYANKCPVFGVTGEDWIQDGLQAFKQNKNDKVVLPEYGGEANITKPRK